MVKEIAEKLQRFCSSTWGIKKKNVLLWVNCGGVIGPDVKNSYCYHPEVYSFIRALWEITRVYKNAYTELSPTYKDYEGSPNDL